MEENQTFIIVDEEGGEHQAVIVYKVESTDEGNKFGKSYIFYYVEDESDEEDGWNIKHSFNDAGHGR